MDEKSLDKLLVSGINKGEIALELNDGIVDSLLEHPVGQVSDAATARVTARLQIRRQDAAIARSKQTVPDMQSLPFGRFLEAVREKAGMTKSQVARRLKKDEDYVSRLERGDLSPVSIPAPDFVDIMGLFDVGIGSASQMIVASMRITESKHTYRAAARSHGGLRHDTRTDDVERALDAFARKMQKKVATSASVPPEVDACLKRIRDELEKRGRKDLLV
jgi:transcriptional regulator with XRE-family HTH domain